VAPPAGGVVIGFIIWTHVQASGAFFLNLIELLAVIAVIAAVWLVYEGRDGFAFAATTVTVAACIISIFVDLYPNVMVSTTSHAYNLTVHNTASGAYSLKAMTVVVIVLLPLVLGYQAWTYYVFRRRVSVSDFRPPPPQEPAPQAALEEKHVRQGRRAGYLRRHR
jgi:cytochrome d ubiquinol oxidase subunit II